jgi:YegS/Rv2252/BmrU family lipid kinase
MNVVPRTVVIVRNPRARRAPPEAELLREVVDGLVTRGWAVDVQNTTAPGHATELAAKAAAVGVDVIAACGGDGTVSEVANGIAGTTAALAVLPAGTTDVWAREAFIPRDLHGAVRAMANARRVRIDLGRARLASGRDLRFLLMCSAGVDAEVVRRLQSGSYGKRVLGRGWYGAVASWVLGRSEPADAFVRVDGEAIERPMLMAVAGNTRLYGGVARLTAGARADDGLLDLCVFSGHGLGHRALLTARAIRGGLDERVGGGVDYARGRRVEIDTEWPVPVQADGEYIGETPVVMEVESGALLALVSPAPNALFARG